MADHAAYGAQRTGAMPGVLVFHTAGVPPLMARIVDKVGVTAAEDQAGRNVIDVAAAVESLEDHVELVLLPGSRIRFATNDNRTAQRGRHGNGPQLG